MKKIVLIASIVIACINFTFSQSEPVYEPWASTMLAEGQTTLNPTAKGLEYYIYHRFAKIENIKDLYGIYGPSNIRMGFNYGITKKISLGFGTEKNNKIQDLFWKINIFEQTEDNKFPVALAYYGDLGLDSRDEAVFGSNYTFTNRLTYYHELIISRKFTEKISVLVAGNYSHFNAIDSMYQNKVVGVRAGGKMNLYNSMNLIVEYAQPFQLSSVNPNLGQFKLKPGIMAGLEIATGTHAFQVFYTTFQNLNQQKNMVFSNTELGDGVLGFNITVRLR